MPVDINTATPKERRQDILNRVVAHAYKQRTPSAKLIEYTGPCGPCTEIFSCLYRGPNGTACFIGALLPDTHYCEGMENATVTSALAKFQLDVIGATEEDYRFLAALQGCHDGPAQNRMTGEDWLAVALKNLEGVALTYGLIGPLATNQEPA